jgi:hypothetical protein
MIAVIQKIPILTTLFSAVFFVVLRRHWLSRGRAPHLFWWTTGVLCYGLGTLTESLVAIFGWSEPVFKAWYILGSLLGGFPLAQGSVFLFVRPKPARAMMWTVLLVIFFTALAVIFSPVDYTLVEPARLTGKVLVWQEIRWVTPFINLYAFVFLVGGAGWSAYRYATQQYPAARMWGNILIAVGGLLPGIGGSFTRFGYTEVLYVTELLGIVLIYCGYALMRRYGGNSIYTNPQLSGKLAG